MLTHLSVFRATMLTHEPDVNRAASFTCGVQALIKRFTGLFS